MRVKVFPAWMYRPPEEIIERLLEIGAGRPAPVQQPRARRDWYYTLARRVRIRAAMRR